MEKYVFTVVNGGLYEAATFRHISITLDGPLIGDSATISQSTTRKLDRPDRRKVRHERHRIPMAEDPGHSFVVVVGAAVDRRGVGAVV